MYSSRTDVRSALFPGADSGMPTEDKSTAASLPNLQIDLAIQEADSIIDTYLGVPSSHSVPRDPDDDTVAVTPVRYWSRNIAAYLATLTFRKGKDLGRDDPVRLRHDDTIALLAMIRDGKTANPLPDPVDPNAAAGDAVGMNLYKTDQPGGGLFSPSDFFGPTRPSPIFGQHKIWPGY